MSKEQAILYYRIAIAIFQKWLDEGVINEVEFVEMEALMADKYNLAKGSIYR